LVVGAEFGDAAGDEDGDLVGVARGGDAVGDEDGGASAHDFAEAGEDALFGVGVDTGEGIVEDEDAGLRMTARAMAVRCFWPPERVMPRSPTVVWKPRGNSRISVAMWAIRRRLRSARAWRRVRRRRCCGRWCRRRGRFPAGRSRCWRGGRRGGSRGWDGRR
jgi:hypothetical protein